MVVAKKETKAKIKKEKTAKRKSWKKRILVALIGLVITIAVFMLAGVILLTYAPSYLSERLSFRLAPANTSFVHYYINSGVVEVDTGFRVTNDAFFPVGFGGADYDVFLKENDGNETLMAEGMVLQGFVVPAHSNKSGRTRLFIHEEGAYILAWEWVTGILSRKNTTSVVKLNGTLYIDAGILGLFPAEFSVYDTIP